MLDDAETTADDAENQNGDPQSSVSAEVLGMLAPLLNAYETLPTVQPPEAIVEPPTTSTTVAPDVGARESDAARPRQLKRDRRAADGATMK